MSSSSGLPFGTLANHHGPPYLLFGVARVCCYRDQASRRGRPPSSSGLGRLPFKEVTRVRIPLGVLTRWRSSGEEGLEQAAERGHLPPHVIGVGRCTRQEEGPFERHEQVAFVLMDGDDGRTALRDYFNEYIDIAVATGVPVLLETPTWRASTSWGETLGYDQSSLDRINRESVDFLRALATSRSDDLTGWEVGGIIGPRGDGYRPGVHTDADECAELHRPQLEAFRDAGAGSS